LSSRARVVSRAGGDHGARPALVVPGVPQCPALVAGDDAETLASSVVGVLGRCGLTRCDDGGAAEWQHFPVGVEAAVTVEMPVCQGAGKLVDRTVQSGASAASAPWVSQPSSAAARTTSPASSSTCRRYSCSSSSGSSTSTVCRLRPRAAQQFSCVQPCGQSERSESMSDCGRLLSRAPRVDVHRRYRAPRGMCGRCVNRRGRNQLLVSTVAEGLVHEPRHWQRQQDEHGRTTATSKSDGVDPAGDPVVVCDHGRDSNNT
jgi:hypothetical protein